MMPPSLSHYSLGGEDQGRGEKVGIHCGDDLLGYERGEQAVWLIWIRACVKAGLLDHLDQQECKAKKNDQLWQLRFECTYSLRRWHFNVSLVLLVLAAG